MDAQYRQFRDVLARVNRAIKGVSADAMRQLGVHIGQNFMLEELWGEDGLTPSELARRMSVEVPTVTRMAQRLETQGLVARIRDTHDKRLLRITLTPAGQKLRVRLPAILDDIAEQGLDGLTPQEREQLIRLLQRIANNMTESAKPSNPADTQAQENDRQKTGKTR